MELVEYLDEDLEQGEVRHLTKELILEASEVVQDSAAELTPVLSEDAEEEVFQV